jgi:three-Cys-motif partner protein
MGEARLDEVGYWSEVKLDIVREYAQAYSTILSAQEPIRRHIYVDAFAGAGVHISRRTGEYVPGSPVNALNVRPPFSEYHFIDLDGDRADMLRQVTKGEENVHVHHGDCNRILLSQVFPRARHKDYHRGLVLLDPYGIDLDWEVVAAAGSMRSIEIFLNFMIMDMNMNVLWTNPDKVAPSQVARMNAFWGDDSWRRAAYRTTAGLFDAIEEKASNEAIAEAYRDRLARVAGFGFVPPPMPMRNSKGAIVYYLLFASPNKTGAKIVEDIFTKHRDRGRP